MEAPRITPEEARKKLESGQRVIFLDTRNPAAWATAEEQLPDAIRVPLAELDQHLEEIPRDGTVIAYCT